jgi:hypothetical protein
MLLSGILVGSFGLLLLCLCLTYRKCSTASRTESVAQDLTEERLKFKIAIKVLYALHGGIAIASKDGRRFAEIIERLIDNLKTHHEIDLRNLSSEELAWAIRVITQKIRKRVPLYYSEGYLNNIPFRNLETQLPLITRGIATKFSRHFPIIPASIGVVPNELQLTNKLLLALRGNFNIHSPDGKRFADFVGNLTEALYRIERIDINNLPEKDQDKVILIIVKVIKTYKFGLKPLRDGLNEILFDEMNDMLSILAMAVSANYPKALPKVGHVAIAIGQPRPMNTMNIASLQP